MLASELDLPPEGYPRFTKCILMVADAQAYLQRVCHQCFCIEYWLICSEAKQLVCYLHLYKSPSHLFIKQGQINYQVCNISFLLHMPLRQTSQEVAVQGTGKMARRLRALAEDPGSVASNHRMVYNVSSFRGYDTLFWLLCAPNMYRVHIHIYREVFSFKCLL